jgi:hypothetical protein
MPQVRDFFQVVTVTSTSYPALSAPQCSFELIMAEASMSLVNKGTKKVTYSFDGANDHGELDPGDPTVGEAFDNRKREYMWLRLSDGEVGTTDVHVKAWTHL